MLIEKYWSNLVSIEWACVSIWFISIVFIYWPFYLLSTYQLLFYVFIEFEIYIWLSSYLHIYPSFSLILSIQLFCSIEVNKKGKYMCGKRLSNTTADKNTHYIITKFFWSSFQYLSFIILYFYLISFEICINFVHI